MRLFIDGYWATQVGCDETVIEQILNSTYLIKLFILSVFNGKLSTPALEHLFTVFSFLLRCTDPRHWLLLNA